MARDEIHLQHNRRQPGSPAELAARAELESHISRPLAESEWIERRTRLLQFVAMLKRWDTERRDNGLTADPKQKAS